MNTALPRWLTALALLAPACIGRPVVGERDPDDAKMTGQCEDDGLNCGDWPEPDAFEPLDDGLFRRGGRCSDARMEMRLEGMDTLSGLDFRCTTVELTVAHDARVTLSQPLIEDAHLIFIAEGAATVTLLAPLGDDASIEVEGMSTLRLLDMAADGLRIDATSGTLGWDLAIDNSALTNMGARTGPTARLTVLGSTVREAAFQAGQLSLATLQLEGIVADVTELTATGTDLVGGELNVRRGSFSSGTMDAVVLQGCESLLISNATVSDSDVGACAAGPLELRNDTVRSSIVRGRSFVLQSRITESVLGDELGSAISLFDSRVSYSLMCTMEALAARGDTVLFCARCHPESPRAACVDDSAAVAVVACPELVEAANCQDELPDALREPADLTSDPEADSPAGVEP